ncbi:hypothetical protein PBI_SMEAGOL_17 [Mycobacterium phage Smeagol]|uniref:Uncharacterized protein n=1 Tax=Mycobacterium phage Doom TaxID=2922222 RepID=G1EUY3_9CAUD|nr:hypothetical protein CL83_gp16 [Mycobacterium phage Doom]AEJ93611.1 hypothetical protein DOOM_16 [Mycobacterium phage Doom]AVO22332.1 hypothetical protein PBI_SMEAGOL_17 [Mycobacterium phage Smeagol]
MPRKIITFTEKGVVRYLVTSKNEIHAGGSSANPLAYDVVAETPSLAKAVDLQEALDAQDNAS